MSKTDMIMESFLQLELNPKLAMKINKLKIYNDNMKDLAAWLNEK